MGWLCVVSHFQSLRELKQLGFLDGGGKGGSSNDVTPFVMAGSVSGDSEDGADVEGSPDADEEAVTEEVKSVTSKDGDDDSDDDADDDEENKNDVENPKAPDSDKEDDNGRGGA